MMEKKFNFIYKKILKKKLFILSTWKLTLSNHTGENKLQYFSKACDKRRASAKYFMMDIRS
jgi:hypothetical protein